MRLSNMQRDPRCQYMPMLRHGIIMEEGLSERKRLQGLVECKSVGVLYEL